MSPSSGYNTIMVDNYLFPTIRLLWPEGHEPAGDQANRSSWGENAVTDLGIPALIDALSPHAHLKEKFRAIFLQLSPQPEVIRYRQDVLEDLLASPVLLQGFDAILPRLTQLAFLSDYPFSTLLEQIVSRLGALELWVECVHELAKLLAAPEAGVRSAGLLRLRSALEAQAADPSFAALTRRKKENGRVTPVDRRRLRREVAYNRGIEARRDEGPSSCLFGGRGHDRSSPASV